MFMVYGIIALLILLVVVILQDEVEQYDTCAFEETVRETWLQDMIMCDTQWFEMMPKKNAATPIAPVTECNAVDTSWLQFL